MGSYLSLLLMLVLSSCNGSTTKTNTAPGTQPGANIAAASPTPSASPTHHPGDHPGPHHPHPRPTDPGAPDPSPEPAPSLPPIHADPSPIASTIPPTVPSTPSPSGVPVGNSFPPVTPDLHLCENRSLKDTSGFSANQIFGAASGLFVREEICAGSQGMMSYITPPDYRTSDQDEQPWIYFAFNDLHSDVEAGLAFQKGGVDGKSKRWLPYLRFHNAFVYGDHAVAIGKKVLMEALYDPQGEVRLYIDSQLACTIQVKLNYNSLMMRRMVTIALPEYNGSGSTGSLDNVIWENTMVTHDFGITFTPFHKETQLAYQYGGVWYGTVYWPSEHIRIKSDGPRDIISIDNSN